MGGGQGQACAGKVTFKIWDSILRARESRSGVQSEGSDMDDLHFEMIIQAALRRMGSGVRLEAGEPVRRLLEWLWERRWWWPGHHTQNGQ